MPSTTSSPTSRSPERRRGATVKVRHAACRAFVLRCLDAGEADVWLDLTTSRGQVRAVAKNGRRSVRRFPGALEPFAHIAAGLAKRQDVWYLEEAMVLETYELVRTDPVALGLMGYAAEALVSGWEPTDVEGPPPRSQPIPLSGGQTHERRPPARAPGPLSEEGGPYRLILELARGLRRLFADPVLAIAGLELKLLALGGTAPHLGACVACPLEPRGPLVALDVAAGGALCRVHARDHPSQAPDGPCLPLDGGLAKVLERLAKMPLSGQERLLVSPAQRRRLLPLVRALAAWHRPHSGRAWRFLRAALSRREPRGQSP